MRKIAALIREYPLTAFFVLAYLFAWLAWAPLVLSKSGLGWLSLELSLWYTLPGSYAPLLAALLVQKAISGNFRIGALVPSPKQGIVAIAAGLCIIVIAFIVLPSLILTEGRVEGLNWLAFTAYPLGIARSILMAGPIGEEPGWRGFALPRLQSRYGAIKATLLLGLLWGAWHLPLFLVPQWAGSPLWIYCLLVFAFGFTINFCFNLSRGSILVAIVMHGIFNASSGVLGLFLADADISSAIRPDLLLAFCFLLAGCVLVLASRGRLGRE